MSDNRALHIILLMQNIKYFIFLLVTTKISYSQQISSFIQSYFHNVNEDQFYVSIGVNQEITSLIVNRWRTWSSLYIINNKQEANNIYLKKVYTSTLLNVDISQSNSSVQFNLGEVCESYYLKPPKILILAQGKDAINLLQSNNWNNSLCLPELILMQLQNGSEVIKEYLTKKSYTRQGQANLNMYFTLLPFESNPKASQYVPPYLSSGKIMKNAQQLTGKETFQLYFQANEYLVMNELFGLSQQKPQYVFALNFNPNTDYIVLGVNQTIIHLSNNSNLNYYRLQISQKLSQIKNFLFIPYLPKISLNLIRLQSQSFCSTKPQIMEIESMTLADKQETQNIQQDSKDKQDYFSLLEYALLVVVMILILLVFLKFCRTIRKDPRKEKHKNLAYSRISKMEDSEQEIQIMYQ